MAQYFCPVYAATSGHPASHLAIHLLITTAYTLSGSDIIIGHTHASVHTDWGKQIVLNKVSPTCSLYRRRIVLELTNINFVFEALDLDKKRWQKPFSDRQQTKYMGRTPYQLF